jgi:hypothetical protein
MFRKEIHDRIQIELQSAQKSRADGNEGRARVCARRAAGVAARAYWTERDGHPPAGGIPDFLERLAELPSLGSASRQAVRNLLQTVDPDHNLPPNVDLIADAEKLIADLEMNLGEQAH